MKIGIIGAGAIARRGHLPAYRAIPEAEVAGIADVNTRLAREVADEFKIPGYYSSIEEMMQNTAIDMVDICTPTHTHMAVVKAAANMGKHIIVEKPLAITLGDAREIEKAVNINNVKLCVCQNYRYYPAVMAARSRVLNGYLGDIVTVHGFGIQPFPSSWTLGTWLYHEGGALYDFGPHIVDMVLWMKDFAKIKKVYASGGDFTKGSMDFINYSVMNIEFDDGTIGVVDISWVTGVRSKVTVDIYGTAGNMAIDVRSNVFTEIHGMSTPFDDLRYFIKKMMTVGKAVITGDYFSWSNLYYKPLIGGFIKSLDCQGEIPVLIEQGMMTMAVLEAAKLSISEGKPIYLGDL